MFSMVSTARTEALLGIHKARTAGLHDPAMEAEEQRVLQLTV